MNQTPSGIPDISELFLVGDLHVDVGQQRVTRADIEIRARSANLEANRLLAGSDLVRPLHGRRVGGRGAVF
jgi:hypothetical protein